MYYNNLFTIRQNYRTSLKDVKIKSKQIVLCTHIYHFLRAVN